MFQINLTVKISYDSISAMDESLFFVRTNIVTMGGTKMRTKIVLACVDCKQRNYNTTKEKKKHPDRMEISKFCRFCNKHTTHRETK